MTSLQSECRFIPFSGLQEGFTIRLFGAVPLTARACEMDPCNFCWISVSDGFTIQDPLPRGDLSHACRVPVGSSFWVQYRDSECEVRIGRRISVQDA